MEEVISKKKIESAIEKNLIWQQLLNSSPGPSNNQLCYLVIRSSLMENFAFKQLLLQNPFRSELYKIMQYAKPEFKIKAFDELVKDKENLNNYLVSTIIQIPDLREKAWQKILELSPKGKDLRLIAGNVEEKKEECWKLLLEEELANDELINIMIEYDSLRKTAWEKFLSRPHSNGEICSIIQYVKELRQPAWNRLMQQHATNSDLLYLIENVPAARKVSEYRLFRKTDDVMTVLRGLQ